MQYIGVARSDAEGLVQVGVRPEVLENMLASTKIDTVLKGIDFGKRGMSMRLMRRKERYWRIKMSL